ncbi:MAG: hypothetical protein JWN82_33 [Candidatus Saccharibacteria bacterium]|nr:hypothetical protein [Candidatus Saccharibacteria bacterium]
MTRILSELLQADQPHFQLQLRALERASGHKNTDIKLSVEVVQAVKEKIRDLGLDKDDTTSEELYHMLLQRVSQDDVRLERALRTRAATYVSADADLMAGMVHALKQDADVVKCFAIKSSVLKRNLKKLAPKRVQKGLGYRSLDAMLRAESPATLVGAALIIESAAWRKSWIEAYKQLSPTDFEEHALRILSPTTQRWQSLSQKMVHNRAHTVLGMSELGALILLPLPQDRPAGMVVASLALALHEINSIAAHTTYLRASQVHGDFAHRVQAVARGGVQLQTPVSQQTMSWQLVQQYFSRVKAAVNEDVFGPYVQAADFQWRNVEERLADICPSMEFWKQTDYLSFLQQGKRVSMNVLDTAINACNALAYEYRVSQHAQQALWHELTLRYLDHESLEAAVAGVLQPQLARETVSSNQ